MINDIFTFVRSFYSEDMGEENVKGWISVILLNTTLAAVLLLLKGISLFSLSFTIANVNAILFVSELLGSAKKVNVNFQDTDG